MVDVAAVREQPQVAVHRPAADLGILGVYRLVDAVRRRVVAPPLHDPEHETALIGFSSFHLSVPL